MSRFKEVIDECLLVAQAFTDISSDTYQELGAVNFEDNTGTVCFSKDGTWFSGSGEFVSEGGGDTSVDSVFFICGRTSEISKCDVSETNGVPNIEHDNLFALNWSRFGSITLEKWSNSKKDWILQ